jgi:hypothetical protein
VGKYALHGGGAGAASRTTTNVQHVLAWHKDLQFSGGAATFVDNTTRKGGFLEGLQPSKPPGMDDPLIRVDTSHATCSHNKPNRPGRRPWPVER